MKNRWRTTAAIVASAICAACTSFVPVREIAEPQVWEYPASAYPTMRITLWPDGRAVFTGGFSYFNPAKWRPGPLAGSITLEISRAASWPRETLAELLPKPESPVLEFSEADRTMTLQRQDYHGRSYLNMLNFYFYKKEACGAA